MAAIASEDILSALAGAVCGLCALGEGKRLFVFDLPPKEKAGDALRPTTDWPIESFCPAYLNPAPSEVSRGGDHAPPYTFCT